MDLTRSSDLSPTTFFWYPRFFLPRTNSRTASPFRGGFRNREVVRVQSLPHPCCVNSIPIRVANVLLLSGFHYASITGRTTS